MIKSVEVCNLGSSVVAGLVPATNPWYGIIPVHHTIIVSAVWVLTQIMQLSVMLVSALSARDGDTPATPAAGGRHQAGHYTVTGGVHHHGHYRVCPFYGLASTLMLFFGGAFSLTFFG